MLVLALLAPAWLIGAQCADAPRDGDGSSVVANGSSYTVAWAHWDQLRVNVYVHNFPRRGPTAARPVRVMRAKMVLDVPELVKTDRGFTLIVNLGDQGIATVSLSPSGKPIGDVRTVFERPATLCGSPVSTGEDVTFGLATTEDDEIVYYLVRLSAGGALASVEVAASGDTTSPSCALARSGDHTAIAAVLGDRSESILAVARLFDDGHFVPAEVDRGGDVEVRGIDERDGRITVAYRRDRLARVASLDEDGSARAWTLQGADARTFDVVEGEEDYTAAWHEETEIVFARYDRRGEEIERLRSERRGDGSPLRMIRYRDECAATWREIGTGFVWLFVVKGCAGDGPASSEDALRFAGEGPPTLALPPPGGGNGYSVAGSGSGSGSMPAQ